MRRYPLILSMISLVVLIAGCESIPTVYEARPIETDLSKYNKLEVVVDSPEQIRKSRGYDVTATELRRQFIADVTSSGNLTVVGAEASTDNTLHAHLSITAFNYVGGAARGTMGIFGGRAILNVVMTLKNKESDAVVGVVSAGDRSNHAQGVFSPTTGRQVTAVAKEFASIISP